MSRRETDESPRDQTHHDLGETQKDFRVDVLAVIGFLRERTRRERTSVLAQLVLPIGDVREIPCEGGAVGQHAMAV